MFLCVLHGGKEIRMQSIYNSGCLHIKWKGKNIMQEWGWESRKVARISQKIWKILPSSQAPANPTSTFIRFFQSDQIWINPVPFGCVVGTTTSQSCWDRLFHGPGYHVDGYFGRCESAGGDLDLFVRPLFLTARMQWRCLSCARCCLWSHHSSGALMCRWLQII